MYINPFIAGVLATILVELLFLVIFVVTHSTIEREEDESDNKDN